MPPENLHLEHTNGTHLKFSWDPVLPPCPPLSYSINAINCGTCPKTVETSTVLCENSELLTEPRVCSIAVQARCDDVSGAISNVLQITLHGKTDPVPF